MEIFLIMVVHYHGTGLEVKQSREKGKRMKRRKRNIEWRDYTSKGSELLHKVILQKSIPLPKFMAFDLGRMYSIQGLI